MGISAFAMVLGAGDLAFAHVRRGFYWVTRREEAQPYLRPKAIRFGKKMRDYYEAHWAEPNMPLDFFIKFHAELCRYKDRFSAAIGPQNVTFVETTPYNDWQTVEYVIHTFEREASQLANDILV